MRLKPVFTEKSTRLAKEGKYTFYVDIGLTKEQIKNAISKTFDVKVRKVRTIKVAGEKKKNIRGRIQIKTPSKKAIATLAEGEKIDLFEEKKKKAKK